MQSEKNRENNEAIPAQLRVSINLKSISSLEPTCNFQNSSEHGTSQRNQQSAQQKPTSKNQMSRVTISDCQIRGLLNF